MTIPSRERLEELRAARKSADFGRNFGLTYELANDELLALLDCALVLRRLEEWLRGGIDREANHVAVDQFGACVGLYDDGAPCASALSKPDLLSAMRAALDKVGAP